MTRPGVITRLMARETGEVGQWPIYFADGRPGGPGRGETLACGFCHRDIDTPAGGFTPNQLSGLVREHAQRCGPADEARGVMWDTSAHRVRERAV